MTLSALKSKNNFGNFPIYRYLTSRGMGWIADYLIIIGTPMVCYQATSDVKWSGLSLVFIWVPRIISLLISGHIVDNYSIRNILVYSDLIRTALALACSITVIVDSRFTVFAILTFAIVSGFLFEICFIGGEKLGSALAPRNTQPFIQSFLTALEQISIISAPAIVGLLLLTQYTWIFATFFACYFLSSLVNIKLSIDIQSKKQESPSSAYKSLTVGLRQIYRDPVLLIIASLALSINFLLSLLNGGGVKLLNSISGGSVSDYGFINSTASIVCVFCLLISPLAVSRIGLWKFGTCVALLAPITFFLLPLSISTVAFAFSITSFLCMDSLFSVFIRTVRANRIPSEVYGSTVALFSLIVIVPMPLAGLTLSLTAPIFSTSSLFMASSVIVLVIIVLLLIGLKSRLGKVSS